MKVRILKLSGVFGKSVIVAIVAVWAFVLLVSTLGTIEMLYDAGQRTGGSRRSFDESAVGR